MVALADTVFVEKKDPFAVVHIVHPTCAKPFDRLRGIVDSVCDGRQIVASIDWLFADTDHFSHPERMPQVSSPSEYLGVSEQYTAHTVGAIRLLRPHLNFFAGVICTVPYELENLVNTLRSKATICQVGEQLVEYSKSSSLEDFYAVRPQDSAVERYEPPAISRRRFSLFGWLRRE